MSEHLINRDKLKAWIAAWDPNEPIDPDDERYLDFGKFDASLRGEGHVQGLYDGITLGNTPSCQLFSGFSGTGKSTELRRLKKDLEADGYTVLLVDFKKYHDLHHPLTFEDMAVLIACAFGDATSELLGADVVQESFLHRLKDYLQTDLEVEEARLKTEILDLKVGIRNARPFWITLRDALAGSPEQLQDNCHGFVLKCVARIKKRERCKDVVFIVDSLEKLSSVVAEDFTVVMNSLLQLFSDSPKLLRLPGCHVVYSIPPYAHIVSPRIGEQFRMRFVLPAVKVFTRGENAGAHEPGIRALTELVERRLPVDEIFGDRRDLLERLITYSGGHIRTLMLFIQELLYGAARRPFPPEEQDVERAVQPTRERLQMAVWREGVPVLAQVLEKGSLAGIAKPLHKMIAGYLDDFVLLCYRNGGGWYEVHPLVRDLVRDLATDLASERATERKTKAAESESE
jgi:hypothetical protein